MSAPAAIGEGRLRLALEAAAEVSGSTLGGLSVLAGCNDPYRLDTPSGHRLGKWFAEQVARFRPPNGTVHLRGLHYRLVASADVRKPDGKPYINSEADWIWLTEKASKAARWLDYVPPDAIRDERNEPPRIFWSLRGDSDVRPSSHVISGRDFDLPSLEDMLPSFHSVGVSSRGRPFRIALIGEKSSLGDVLEPIAKKVGGELLLPAGECSDSMIAGMVERAVEDGRPLRVLYFSDFDPSGWQMPVSVARKIQAHRHSGFPELRAELHAVCLTLEQVRSLGLPSTPLKESERRADRWREVMKHEQTEIDALAALRPDVLRKIAEDAVTPFFDETLHRRQQAARFAWGRVADNWFLSLPAYRAAEAEISEAHEALRQAGEKLAEVRDRAKTNLDAAVEKTEGAPIPPNPPEPKITAAAPEPLFSTDDDFVEATRKLIARKSLTGGAL